MKVLNDFHDYCFKTVKVLACVDMKVHEMYIYIFMQATLKT